MPKQKNLKRKRNKKPQNRAKRQLQKTKQLGRSKIVGIAKTVGASLTILATFSGLLSLVPDVSVGVKEILQSGDPFSVPFTIENNGPFTIHDVSFRFKLRNVTSEDKAKIITTQGITPSDFLIKHLHKGETTSTGVPFPVHFQSPVESADVEFILIYRPSFYPFLKEQPFRFGLSKNRHGEYIWLPIAMSYLE